MLAEQMAATHVLAMKELGHLRRSENIAQHDSHGSMAALAGALTSNPTDALAQALMNRQAGQAVPPVVAEQTKRLTQALMRAGVASAPSGQRYVGAQ